MQIASRRARLQVISLLLACIPDILVSMAIADFLQIGIVGFLMTISVIQVLYGLRWLSHALLVWLTFVFRDRKIAADDLVERLTVDEFPIPDEQITSPASYLTDIIDDRGKAPEVRICATVALSSLQAQQAFGLQAAWRATIVWEDALEKYRRMLLHGEANLAATQ